MTRCHGKKKGRDKMRMFRRFYSNGQPHIPDDTAIHLLLEISLLTFQIRNCADDCRNGKDSVSLERLYRIKTYLETAFDLFFTPEEVFTEGSDEENL